MSRRRTRRPATRRWMIGAACLIAIAAGAAAWSLERGEGTSAAVTPPRGESTTSPPRPSGAGTPTERVVVRQGTALPEPVQDPAVTRLGDRVYAFGGLDSSGASTAAVTVIAGHRVRHAQPLPIPLHDAGASAAGGRLVVIGGGQSQSEPGIYSYSPRTGSVHQIGVLPMPLSDVSTVADGPVTYVVGGYTGRSWSDAILAVRGGRVTVAGRLPHGLRYAAAAMLNGAVVIAGGRTLTGPSAAIYRFDPSAGSVRRIGTLPEPLMHAGAGTLDGRVLVVGGIGQDGRTERRVVAIDAAGRTRVVATLPRPISDAGVATLPGRVLVVGGSDGRRPLQSVLSLEMTTIVQAPSQATPLQPPAMFRGPLPGDLLIADRGNDRMLIVNPRGRIIWRYPSRPGQRRLSFDDDAFFTPGGRSIISNEEDNHDIVEIAYPSGKLLWHYGHPGVPGSAPGFLNTPDDAYRLSNGLVIVSDDRNCRLVEIRGHRVVRTIGRTGLCTHTPPRGIGLPNGDTPLPNGDILVSEISGSYVDEFTLRGRLVRSVHAPVGYPSDPQLTHNGNILLADYSRPGAVVIINRRTGHLIWRYGPASGPGALDHPSLATMLPNGKILVVDDYNHRIVVIDRMSRRIVWHYGHRGVPGTGHGYLRYPDGFDFIPVTADGRADPAAIVHGR